MTVEAPIPLPVLTTARLVLDALAPDDTDALFHIHSHPDAARYLSMEPMTDRAQAVARLAHLAQRCAAGEDLSWAVRRARDARLVGLCILKGVATTRRRAEIGYVIAPDLWRQGYAREAVAAVLAWGFGRLGLNRIEALVYAENEASRALLRTLGFAEEGYLREHSWEKGRYWDDVICALLARDYYGNR